MNFYKTVHFLFLLFLLAAIIPNTLHAQTDTVSKKQIIILHSQRLNYQRTDSAEFQSVVGEALLKTRKKHFFPQTAFY